MNIREKATFLGKNHQVYCGSNNANMGNVAFSLASSLLLSHYWPDSVFSISFGLANKAITGHV